MEFVVVYEHNHKDEEVYIHYCQWTGNEESLTNFFDAIENADYEQFQGGHYSSFRSSTTKLPESVVNAHMNLENLEYTFKKHVGKFRFSKLDTEDPYEIAEILQDFWRGRLRDFFGK